MRAIFYTATALTALIAATPALSAQPADTSQSAQTATDAAKAAAQAASDQVGDIIVTAQRRRERAQDVPIAITAFSSQQLEAKGITNALALGNYVPNLVAQNNTGIGSANAYFLRGLGSTETIATFDPPVGTYVDDIYLSRQNANNLSMFDVERVEVLRGPQGTLFGRNTTGGAINVIMAQPADQFGGTLELGFGSYGKTLARASVDAPLGNGLGIKVSGYIQNDSGYVRNVTTGQHLNDDDGWGLRLGAKAKLGSTVNWTGSVMHVVSKGDNLLNFTCNPANRTMCNGRYVTTGLRAGFSPPFPAGVITGRKSAFGLGQTATSTIYTSKFDWEIADKTNLSFITGYVDLSQQFLYDFADGRGGFPSITNPRPAVVGNPLGGYDIINDGRHQQFSQEIKLTGTLNRLNYVAGVYYLNERNRTDLADYSPPFGGLLADRLLRNTTKAFAGYVQGDFKATDQLTLTAGVRYTDETKKLNIHDNRATCQTTPVPVTCLDNANLTAANGRAIPRKLTTRLWTPRFAINFKPNADVLLFASATRGFKSGGWNARETSPTRFLPFNPEKVWSYEAGFKSDWLGKRLRVNMTAFQLDVSDLQILAGVLNANGTASFITRNFSDYRNRGLEIELLGRPLPGLEVYANMGIQHDKYVNWNKGPAVDPYGVPSVATQLAACQAALAAGNVGTRAPVGGLVSNCGNGIVTAQGTISTPVRTPNFTLATGANYRFPLGQSGWSMTPSINGTYRTKQEVAIANVSLYDAPINAINCPGGTCVANPNGNGAFISGSRSPGGWLVNASLMLANPGDQFTISAECQNCFDKTYIQSSLFNYSYLSMPRTWMVRSRVRF